MKIVKTFGSEGLATVYIGETGTGKYVEFCESLEPPFTRDQKWVLIISSLHGCPIECEMCDAGGSYRGGLSAEEILDQIDYMVMLRYPERRIPAEKFKIQFARIGEPSFNNNVLKVLERLPEIYHAPGLIPAISTVAPAGSDPFFARLLEIKERLYPESFQLQFSIHSTDRAERDRIIPADKWGLDKIATYGTRFHKTGGRKITLNFALAEDYTIDPEILREIFSPDHFFIKMTPLNPTCRAQAKGLNNGLANMASAATTLTALGYDLLVSIGEPEENLIGSNCGQYIKTFEEYSKTGKTPRDAYSCL